MNLEIKNIFKVWGFPDVDESYSGIESYNSGYLIGGYQHFRDTDWTVYSTEILAPTYQDSWCHYA
jgi:hypothetical protein